MLFSHIFTNNIHYYIVYGELNFDFRPYDEEYEIRISGKFGYFDLLVAGMTLDNSTAATTEAPMSTTTALPTSEECGLTSFTNPYIIDGELALLNLKAEVVAEEALRAATIARLNALVVTP